MTKEEIWEKLATEANRASIDGDFDIFGNLAHSDSFMVYLQGINLKLSFQGVY